MTTETTTTTITGLTENQTADAIAMGLEGGNFFGYSLAHYYVFGDHVPGQFLSRDTHGRAVMARNEEGWCAAIDPYHLRCTIYSQRPAICRQFSMGGDDCRRERQDYLRQADAWALSSPST